MRDDSRIWYVYLVHSDYDRDRVHQLKRLVIAASLTYREAVNFYQRHHHAFPNCLMDYTNS